MGLNKESRTTNATKNAFSAVFNKLILLLLTFISRKFFIEYIGIEYLGINGLFSNILTLLSMADLGLGTAMNVSLYKPIAEGDTNKITSLLNYYKVIYRYIAIGVTVLGLMLLPFLQFFINTETEIPNIYVYYLVFLAKNIVSYLFVYKSSLIRADQKTYIINRKEIIINFAKTALQIISILVWKNYLIYIVIDVFALLVLNLLISHEANQRYEFIRDNIQIKKDEKKVIFSDIFSVFLYKVAWTLLNGTDNIIISVLSGTIIVGMYSNYFTVTNNIETLIALIFTSLTASVGNLVATSSSENKYKTFKTMQMISFWLSGVVCICLFFLLQDFIQLWLGKEYLLDELTLVAVVVNLLFSICMRPVWTFREGTGMYRQIKYIMFVTAILNIVLSIILGYLLGISGVLFATAISKYVTYFWYEPNILFKNFFKVRVCNYYIDYIKNIGLLIVTGLICYIPLYFISEVSIISWIIKAIICLVIVNGIYLLRYFKAPEFINALKKAKSMFKKQKNDIT